MTGADRVDKLVPLVEAMLFVADGPVEVGRLARALEVSKEDVGFALEQLTAQLADRGLRLQRGPTAAGDQVQLVTAPEAVEAVERFLGVEAQSKLSSAAMETLAVVAYRQPVTRAAVEAIRGVNSDRVLATLEARGLIEEVGRLETAGRPALFGTTFGFLEYLGLPRLEDLPSLTEGLAGAAASLSSPRGLEGAAAAAAAPSRISTPSPAQRERG